MKQEFKVGDLVGLPHWTEYFKVSFITETDIELVTEDKYYATYPLSKGFIKKEETVMKGEIDPSKKYRKVGTHEPVRIICTDRKVDDGSLPCVGLWLAKPHIEAMVYFNCEGVDLFGTKIIEEIPKTDWSNVQVDTLIWVGNTPRYFHAYSAQDDVVCFHKDGATSVTNISGTSWVKSWACSLEKPSCLK